jgi:hypothetical protein
VYHFGVVFSTISLLFLVRLEWLARCIDGTLVESAYHVVELFMGHYFDNMRTITPVNGIPRHNPDYQAVEGIIGCRSNARKVEKEYYRHFGVGKGLMDEVLPSARSSILYEEIDGDQSQNLGFSVIS